MDRDLVFFIKFIIRCHLLIHPNLFSFYMILHLICCNNHVEAHRCCCVLALRLLLELRIQTLYSQSLPTKKKMAKMQPDMMQHKLDFVIFAYV